jgi:hypothetical protein
VHGNSEPSNSDYLSTGVVCTLTGCVSVHAWHSLGVWVHPMTEIARILANFDLFKLIEKESFLINFYGVVQLFNLFNPFFLAAKTYSTPRRALKDASNSFEFDFTKSGFTFSKEGFSGLLGGMFSLVPEDHGGETFDFSSLFVKDGDSFSKYSILLL